MSLFLPQNLAYLIETTPDMTQTTLAKKLNVSQQAVSKWIASGVGGRMDLETLIEIGSIFDRSIDDLLKKDLRETDKLQPVEEAALAADDLLKKFTAFVDNMKKIK
jgi:predicted transcriptional regulator